MSSLLKAPSAGFTDDYSLLSFAATKASLSDAPSQNTALQALTQVCNDTTAIAAVASDDLPLALAAALNLITAKQTATLCTAADTTDTNAFNSAYSAAVSAVSGVTVGSAEASAYANFLSDISAGDLAQARTDATAVLNAAPAGSNFGYTINSDGTFSTTATDGSGATYKLTLDSTTWAPTVLDVESPDSTSIITTYAGGSSTAQSFAGPNGTGLTAETTTNNTDDTSTVQQPTSDGTVINTYNELDGAGPPVGASLNFTVSGSEIASYETLDGSPEGGMTFWSGPDGTGTALMDATILQWSTSENFLGLNYVAPGETFDLASFLADYDPNSTAPSDYGVVTIEEGFGADALFVTVPDDVMAAYPAGSYSLFLAANADGPVFGIYDSTGTQIGTFGATVFDETDPPDNIPLGTGFQAKDDGASLSLAASCEARASQPGAAPSPSSISKSATRCRPGSPATPRSSGSAIATSIADVIRCRKKSGRCAFAPARSGPVCRNATYGCRPTMRCSPTARSSRSGISSTAPPSSRCGWMKSPITMSSCLATTCCMRRGCRPRATSIPAIEPISKPAMACSRSTPISGPGGGKRKAARR